VTADADCGAPLALGGHARPSVVLLRSSDHLTPDEQADLLRSGLEHTGDDLEAGAIASMTRLDSLTHPSADASGRRSVTWTARSSATDSDPANVLVILGVRLSLRPSAHYKPLARGIGPVVPGSGLRRRVRATAWRR